jgi:hypothetical protein
VQFDLFWCKFAWRHHFRTFPVLGSRCCGTGFLTEFHSLVLQRTWFLHLHQIVLPDDLEKKLRDKAAAKFGFKKGSLSKAVAEAIKKWLRA